MEKGVDLSVSNELWGQSFKLPASLVESVKYVTISKENAAVVTVKYLNGLKWLTF